MNFESFLHKKDPEVAKYPNLSPEDIKHAKAYLGLVVDGVISGGVNIDKKKAVEDIAKIEKGEAADYVIIGHAADYLDYLNGEEIEK